MSFIFDRDFDLEITEEARRQSPSGAPKHSDEDLASALEAARAAAFEEGRAAGRAEAEAEQRESELKRLAAATEALSDRMTALVRTDDAHRAALETQMLDFAGSVCEQVFPELIASKAHERAMSQARRALSLGIGSSRLCIALSPNGLDMLSHDLNELLAEIGLAGRVDIVADPALHDGDARASWEGGALDYSFSTICNNILSALRSSSAAVVVPNPSRSDTHVRKH